ncbi:MAG: 30S ribosomal protein S1 [Pseudomonadota bacterium]|nr:30S ribosomal protein S1 [Pseudomonadota bacterium]
METEINTLSESAKGSDENFDAMLEETFKEGELTEGSVVKGTVIAVESDSVLIDVGLKSEGRVALKEFASPGVESEITAGDIVDVYLERMEDNQGQAILSREKARREEAWALLEKAFNNNERVTGVIFGRVKGGFTVDLSGAIAFLPGSQVDVRPLRDINPLMGGPQPFQILKIDRRRGNIVVSRRAVLEESRAEQKAELLSQLKEGQTVEGIVKNLTDYGAFVDLGGVDGLLHVTDVAWHRISHPSEVLTVGQTVKVQVIKFNTETQRISLGMKQLQEDPWNNVETKFPLNAQFTGRVSNITDYGAFVELEPGIEGLVHVSEMSWTKKNVHPGKIISTSQEVDVVVLDVDHQKRRISLGIKQTQQNPWNDFQSNYSSGNEIEGEITNITEFGLFIGLPGEIDGMIHLSDLSWEKSGEEAIKGYTKGDKVKVRILDIDIEKERISLGIKQLTENPFETAISEIKKGEIVTCTVTNVTESGLEVSVSGKLSGFIRRVDLSREKSEQRPDRFAIGDRIDAQITNIDRREHKLTLSIKAHEINEEKRAMADYGSSDSGASLGDILGAAIRKASEDEVTSEPEVDQSNELKKSDTENLEQEEDKSDKNSENEEKETSELASADSEEDSKNKK